MFMNAICCISRNFRGPKTSRISQNLGTNHINFFSCINFTKMQNLMPSKISTYTVVKAGQIEGTCFIQQTPHQFSHDGR